MSTSSPCDRSARARSTTQSLPPTISGNDAAGRVTPSHLATGTAVRPYSITVPTMTRDVAGRMSAAPGTPSLTSDAENVEAVAAATMPRGSIHPMNARSPLDRSVRNVATRAASGRATSTSTATSPSVGSSTSPTDSGVTVDEIEMNKRPMTSWMIVSKNGRRAGMSKPGRLARAMPMTIAAMRPVSSRAMSHAAATATTVASVPEVLRTSGRLRRLRSSHSNAVPTTPPASPTPMLAKNWPSS
jgi:hypothetical protein